MTHWSKVNQGVLYVAESYWPHKGVKKVSYTLDMWLNGIKYTKGWDWGVVDLVAWYGIKYLKIYVLECVGSG